MAVEIGKIAAAVPGFAYIPLATINYHFGFSWRAIGFGLAAGTNITFTNTDTAIQYGLGILFPTWYSG